MIARMLLFLRTLVRRRRSGEPVSRGVWADFESVSRRPPAKPRWVPVIDTWKVHELTAAELLEDQRPARPARRRWLDRSTRGL
jgi:hypothetical protein